MKWFSQLIKIDQLLLKQHKFMYIFLFTIHFRDGVRQSGLFIAACYLLDKLKVDREVDVCYVVKQIRRSRPQFVTSLVG